MDVVSWKSQCYFEDTSWRMKHGAPGVSLDFGLSSLPFPRVLQLGCVYLIYHLVCLWGISTTFLVRSPSFLRDISRRPKSYDQP